MPIGARVPGVSTMIRSHFDPDHDVLDLSTPTRRALGKPLLQTSLIALVLTLGLGSVAVEAQQRPTDPPDSTRTATQRGRSTVQLGPDGLPVQSPSGFLNRMVRSLRQRRRDQSTYPARDLQERRAVAASILAQPGFLVRRGPVLLAPLGRIYTPGREVIVPGFDPVAPLTVVLTYENRLGSRAVLIYNPGTGQYQERILTNNVDRLLNPIGAVTPNTAVRRGSGIIERPNVDTLGPRGRAPLARQPGLPGPLLPNVDTLGPRGRRP